MDLLYLSYRLLSGSSIMSIFYHFYQVMNLLSELHCLVVKSSSDEWYRTEYELKMEIKSIRVYLFNIYFPS